MGIKANNNEDNKTRETAIIGCKSYKYFKSNLLIEKAYPKYQKCGLRGVTRLFQDGWKKEK